MDTTSVGKNRELFATHEGAGGARHCRIVSDPRPLYCIVSDTHGLALPLAWVSSKDLFYQARHQSKLLPAYSSGAYINIYDAGPESPGENLVLQPENAIR